MGGKSQKTYDAILDFINSYYEDNLHTPSVIQIANGTNVSTATVCRYMQDMRDKGIISYNGHSGIVTNKMKNKRTLVPIVGSISCGPLTEAVEDIEGYVEISEVLSNSQEYFLLRAKGNSMINAGINDKDLVLIEKRNSADNGEIIVALVDGEATLKRFYKEKGKVRLHPENDEMDDIIIDNAFIQGVAKKVIKDIE